MVMWYDKKDNNDRDVFESVTVTWDILRVWSDKAAVMTCSIELYENRCDQLLFFFRDEGSCQGRLSNTPGEQSKHRWREGDGFTLIEKVINITDILLAYWEGQKRTGDHGDKSGASDDVISQTSSFIRSFSRGASDSCVNMVDDKSWWHIDSIMCLFLERSTATRSLIGSITHTSANKPRLARQKYSQSGNDSPLWPSSINVQFNYCFSPEMHVKETYFPQLLPT